MFGRRGAASDWPACRSSMLSIDLCESFGQPLPCLGRQLASSSIGISQIHGLADVDRGHPARPGVRRAADYIDTRGRACERARLLEAYLDRVTPLGKPALLALALCPLRCRG